jgi:two-component system, cell cycle response regulator DivK
MGHPSNFSARYYREGRSVVLEGSPLVLLVDDDANTRRGYVELLESCGFRVMAAKTANEAVAWCGERMPDAVVTDIALPGRNGFELATDLKLLPAARDLRILAMTAYWASDVHDRAARAGISAVVAKPCHPDHLIAELRRVLRKPN